MLMAGAKLLDERRAPELDEHRAAISGNICRCTGYRKILDAMEQGARELAAREPRPETAAPAVRRMNLIGAPVARPDARAKVTGAARYPADLVRAEMLRCKVVFAHRAHARIVRLDTARALARARRGRGADRRRRAVQPLRPDRRRPGSAVQRARALHRRPGRAGRRRDAPRPRAPPPRWSRWSTKTCRWSATRSRRSHPDAPLVHPERGTNVLLHQKIRKGDVEAAFAAGRRRAERHVHHLVAGARLPPARRRHRLLRRRASWSSRRPGSGCTRTAARSPRCWNCPRTRSSCATPRSAARSAGARTSRCSRCWRWRPGS